MYNLAKKYLVLGLSLSLLIVVAIFFFNQEDITAPAPEIAHKKQTKLTHIKYEGAVLEEVDNIDDIIIELDTIQTAGTFSLTAMAQSITAEALKAFSSSDENSLPLLSHWNADSNGMDPMYMIGRIEQGEHILVSWKLDPYYADTIGISYYEESIIKAAELQLPLVFVLPAPESALTQDDYYKNLSKEDNPNVIDENNNTLDKLSPFGPDERWNEVGNQWSTSDLMVELQGLYPDPPLVVFISEDEAAKLSWNEISTASRYSEYNIANSDDNYKRILLGGKWIEKYRQMQNGFKEGFTQDAWKNNVKFISNNNFSDDFGKSSNWIDDATVTNQYINLWPLTTDGSTIDFDLTGTKSDTTANSPHILANNLSFMLKEAKSVNQNPNFAYQLNLDDASKITDSARYRGLTQFALWFLRPNFIRQKSSSTTLAELEPMFKEVVDSIELIHYNSQVAEFWKNGELVQNGDSYLNENIPVQYQNDPRWFLLDTDKNPAKPWSDSTNIKVWAFALVKGETPNREWLIYAQSPEGNISGVTIDIPGYGNVLVNSSVNGNFYETKESNIDSVIPINQVLSTTITEYIQPGILFDDLVKQKAINTEITSNKRIFYVDATKGLDTNDGLTEDTAWKTMDKVKSFSYSIGDAVLFKRGEIFHGELSYLKNFYGEIGNHNILGAYGSGNQPILTSLKEQLLTWTLEGGNIYTTPVPISPNRVLQNGSEILEAYSVSHIDGTQYKWYYDQELDLLYVHFDGNPDDSTISYSNDNSTIKLTSGNNFITIQDLNIQSGYSHALYIYQTNNIKVKNCTIGKYSCDGITVTGGIGTKTVKHVTIEDNIIDSEFTFDYSNAPSTILGHREGIVFYASVHDTNITNNFIKNWGHTNINLSATEENTQRNLIIKNNYSTAPDIDYGGGLSFNGDIGDVEISYNYFLNMPNLLQLSGHDLHFHHNVVAHTINSEIKFPDSTTADGFSYGAYTYSVYNNVVEYNTFMDLEGEGYYQTNKTNGNYVYNNIIRNNIFSEAGLEGTSTDGIIMSIFEPDDGQDHAYNNQIVDNIMYTKGFTKTCKYYGTVYDVNDFNNASDMHRGNVDTPPLLIQEGVSIYKSTDNSINEKYGAFAPTK